MGSIGFDNNQYLKLQSENIRKRIEQFGGKLYLEFGASSSTTTTPPGCCRASSRTARCGCCWR